MCVGFLIECLFTEELPFTARDNCDVNHLSTITKPIT
jgi:hypothetical protein